ncbi:MAG: N-methyl-L-tryptophan oxidase [Planctomycetota bacterium]
MDASDFFHPTGEASVKTASSCDAVVLGLGGVGSAAAWKLAARGLRVIGVDRFTPPHDQGSSHGQTRIIRQAYFEHPDYVPLCQRAYTLWAALEEPLGERLFERTGLIEAGPADGVVVQGVLHAAAEHGLPVERFTAAEARSRWPQFHVPDELAVVHEPTGGMLYVERCVQACLDAARLAGADLRRGVTARGWRSEPGGVVLETDQGEVSADRLVVAAGPWAGGLLGELGVPLEVRRKSLFWFDAPADGVSKNHSPDAMPPFLFELPDGVYYGFPSVEPWGVKVGDHAAGKPLARPEDVDRSIDRAEQQAVERFVETHLPSLKRPAHHHATCFYTMTPDEHFVVDRLPSDERICMAAGMSGHGYKFTPVLGEALADLAIDGETTLPIGFLAASRFA